MVGLTERGMPDASDRMATTGHMGRPRPGHPTDALVAYGFASGIATLAVAAGFWAGARHLPILAALSAAAAIAGLIFVVRRAQRRAGRRQDDAMHASLQLAATMQEAVDALGDGLIVYDADDRVALTNRRYRELHAINPLASVPGVSFEDQFRAAVACGEIPAAEADVEGAVQERLAMHRSAAGAIERHHGEQWLRISEHRTASGGIVGIHADITDLKRAQATAEAAERLLRDAVDCISEGFVIYDAEDRLVMCNQRYKALYPGSADVRVPGARFEDIVRTGLARGDFPGAIGREEEWLAERLRQRRLAASTVEQRLANDVWILATERRMTGGGIAGLRIDITDLKKAQAALTAAGARMADFAGVASDWFWEADAEGRITYLSEPFEAATGASIASRIGALRRDLDRDRDPDNPGWDAHLADVAARRPFRNFVMTSRFDRLVQHLSVSGKPLFGEDGSFLGYRGVIRNVTPEIEAQRALARQKEELSVIAEKLRAANAAKSLFLANMSHELRTPLNAILGFSEIMREPQTGPENPKYREYARDIHSAGEYLLRLINDVLDTSKMEAGALRLDEETVRLDQIIDECRRLVLDKIRERRVEFVVDLPPDLPRASADRLRLKQAVLNVLANAVKFTPPGGHVSVSVTGPVADGLAIVIADTGIGMKMSEIPIALEPFRQVDGSFVRRYEGSGLGLPLAKTFIELHDGRLEIESEPGKGTTVRLWLPRRRLLPGSDSYPSAVPADSPAVRVFDS